MNNTIVTQIRTSTLSAVMLDRTAELYRVDVAVLAEYTPEITELTDLDNGGEPCSWCQEFDCVIAAQVYGVTPDGARVSTEAGLDCVGRAMRSTAIDPHQPVQLELVAWDSAIVATSYLPLAPKAGA